MCVCTLSFFVFFVFFLLRLILSFLFCSFPISLGFAARMVANGDSAPGYECKPLLGTLPLFSPLVIILHFTLQAAVCFFFLYVQVIFVKVAVESTSHDLWNVSRNRLLDVCVCVPRSNKQNFVTGCDFACAEYRTVSGVAGPLVILEKVKVCSWFALDVGRLHFINRCAMFIGFRDFSLSLKGSEKWWDAAVWIEIRKARITRACFIN